MIVFSDSKDPIFNSHVPKTPQKNLVKGSFFSFEVELESGWAKKNFFQKEPARFLRY